MTTTNTTEKPAATHKGKDILTSPIFPPIPVRGLDWAATFDGYEPGDLVGHGENEQRAIEDLIEQAEENEGK